MLINEAFPKSVDIGSDKCAKLIVPGKLGQPNATECRQLHPSFNQRNCWNCFQLYDSEQEVWNLELSVSLLTNSASSNVIFCSLALPLESDCTLVLQDPLIRRTKILLFLWCINYLSPERTL